MSLVVALWMVLVLSFAFLIHWSFGEVKFRWSRSRLTDLSFLSLHLTGWIEYTTILFSFGLALPIRRVVGTVTGNHLLHVQSMWLAVTIYFVVSSFVDYWHHRFWHTRLAWFFHRMHHSATEYSPLLTYRVHPIERTFDVVFRIAPLCLIELSGPAFAFAGIMNGLITILIHTDSGLKWGWFGRWLVISPRAHKIHHSPLAEHENVNFGIILPLWDHVFGTWYEGQVINEEVGIAEPVHNRSFFLIDVLIDMRDFVRQSLLILFNIGSSVRVSKKALAPETK
jgi:sterol desaturase/sphingolipid hydroxylase (fatty acid hydroxylase superfamily)